MLNKKNLILIIISFLIFSFFLKTEVKETNIESNEIENINYITNLGNKLLISGFENIDSNINIDGKDIFFTGTHEEFKYKNYRINLEDKKIFFESYESNNNIDKIKVVENSIYYEEEKIIDNVYMQDDKLFYEISEDNSKIIYYNGEDINTYNLDTGYICNVNYDFNFENHKDFIDKIQLSKEAGYFYYKDEGLISIFGADSGRKYSDGFYGKSPKWYSNEKLIFINNNKNLGTFNSKYRDFEYFYRSKEDIFNEYMINDFKIVFFVKQDNEKFDIRIYDYNENSCKLLDKNIYNSEFNKFCNENLLVIKEDNDLYIYNFNDKRHFSVENINQFYDGSYFKVLGDKIAVNKNNKILLLNGYETTNLFEGDSQIQKLIFTDDTAFFVLKEKTEEYKIMTKEYN